MLSQALCRLNAEFNIRKTGISLIFFNSINPGPISASLKGKMRKNYEEVYYVFRVDDGKRSHLCPAKSRSRGTP